MKLVFDRKSPECGWEPFVQWLDQQGVKATSVRALEVDTDTLEGEATVYKRDRMSTKTRRLRLSSLPPLHPNRSAA